MRNLKNHKTLFISIVIVLITISCGNQKDNKAQQDSNSINTNNQTSNTSTELKTGGIYIIKNIKNEYYAVKILVVDDLAVHLRSYANKFIKKPENLNSSDLDIMIGHSPIDKEGFLLDKPELINVEEVKDSELEGYKIYLEEMKKQN